MGIYTHFCSCTSFVIVACSAGVFLVGKTLFVFVLNIVVAAIFDFMTVEDWGE